MSHHHETSKESHCPDCALEAFARNHYFTGKLLVERDFTDEQRYHRDKLRLHHQALHGWGVVCGLKVKQHPEEPCQSKYVIIEPGVAIDCCGHEILVREEVRFNFAQSPEVQALQKANDIQPHSLQICLRYKECGTEEIPVLYDECGCDDTKCAPNRILESFELGVFLDEETVVDEPHSAKLERSGTIPYAHSAEVALHSGSRRLFVMTVDPSGTAIYAIDTDDGANVDSVTMTDKARAVAVSADGKEVYLALTISAEINVLDAANLKDAVKAKLTPGTAAEELTVLAPALGGALVALFGVSGDVAIWDAPIAAGDPSKVIPISPGLSGLVVSPDGKRAYVADKANSKVRVLDLIAKTHNNADDIDVADSAPGSPPSAPSSVAVAHSTSGDTLLVGDADNSKIYLVPLGVAGTPAITAAKLTHSPIAMVASPGANWVYVLETNNAGKFFVEPVSTQRLLLGKPALGKPLEVPANSETVALSESGETLYVPFNGDKGGVAILDVSEEDCGDLLWQSLDGCPSCDTANCIVLATVENYQVGDKLKDQTDPTADAPQDDTDNVVRIDNRSGRRLLPSTQVLTEVVECLLEHGTGGGGQGLPGPPGLSGTSVNSADAFTVLPISPATATFNPATGHIHFEIPQGAPGAPGVGTPGPSGEGLEKGLTRISALSWRHNSRLNPFTEITRLSGNRTPGIVVGFTKDVFVSDPTHPVIDGEHVFQVLVEHGTSEPDLRTGFKCRCSVIGEVIPVKAVVDSPGHINSAVEVPSQVASAVAFIFPEEISILIKAKKISDLLWVILRGDFIVDVDGRAIDGEFVRAELPTGDRPAGSDFGVQGGTFESWFTIGD